MTGCNSVTRLFQTKMMPQPLSNTCDFVLQSRKFPITRKVSFQNKKLQSENYDLTETPDHQVWKRKAEVGNNKSRQPGIIKVASYQQIDLPRDPFVLDIIHVNIN